MLKSSISASCQVMGTRWWQADTARASRGYNDTAPSHPKASAASLPELCPGPHRKGALRTHRLRGVSNTAENAGEGGSGIKAVIPSSCIHLVSTAHQDRSHGGLLRCPAKSLCREKGDNDGSFGAMLVPVMFQWREGSACPCVARRDFQYQASWLSWPERYQDPQVPFV